VGDGLLDRPSLRTTDREVTLAWTTQGVHSESLWPAWTSRSAMEVINKVVYSGKYKRRSLAV
jgi:hypothetical protein